MPTYVNLRKHQPRVPNQVNVKRRVMSPLQPARTARLVNSPALLETAPRHSSPRRDRCSRSCQSKKGNRGRLPRRSGARGVDVDDATEGQGKSAAARASTPSRSDTPRHPSPARLRGRRPHFRSSAGMRDAEQGMTGGVRRVGACGSRTPREGKTGRQTARGGRRG
jgi:hypothetical protein